MSSQNAHFDVLDVVRTRFMYNIRRAQRYIIAILYGTVRKVVGVEKKKK